MAYGIHFGVVPLSQITSYQAHEVEQLTPSRIAVGSHISPGYVERVRLRDLLFEAFDGGETLRSDLWHPFRVPQFHRADRAATLASSIASEFDAMLSTLDANLVEAYEADLGDIVSLFSHAATGRLCVVSTLDLPFDRDRAERIVLPFPCEQPGLDQRT